MAALSNELQVGVGSYAISESDSATTLTLYSHATRNYVTAHECSETLTVGTIGTVISRSSVSRSDTFDSDYTDILNKYLKVGVSWYKIKTKPTRSATNETVVSGTAAEVELFVTGKPEAKFAMIIGDDVEASGGSLVLTNKQFIEKAYNDDFTDLEDKAMLLDSKFYTISEFTNSSVSTEEVIGTDTKDLYYLFGPNCGESILEYASAWSYDSRGVGIVTNDTTVELLDYDTSSIDTFLATLIGTYQNLEYYEYDERKEAMVINISPSKCTAAVQSATPASDGTPMIKLTYTRVDSPPVAFFTIKATMSEQTHSADFYSITVPGYLVSSAISGSKFNFTNEEIISLEGVKSIAVDGDDLSVDTLTPEIEYQYFPKEVFKPTDYKGIKSADGLIICGHFTEDIGKLEYGSPVKYINDGNVIGTFYTKNVRRTGKKKYTINAMSFIGLLDKKYHAGGVYVAVRFDTILGSILGDLTDITVQTEVAETVLTGYLPYATARENLHQLLFATGAVVLRSDDGKLIFSYLLPNAHTTAIQDARVYDDGEVEYLTPCSKIELTEYSYELLDDTELSSIYDNTQEAIVTNKKVIFGTAPVDPTTFSVSNGKVSVNYPKFSTVLSGTGTFTFTYDGTDWSYNGTTIALEDYGLAVDDEIASGNSITVTITSTSRAITGVTSTSTDSFSVNTETANCNHAYVTGRGILSAKAYTQASSIVEKDNEDAQEDYQENVVTSSDVTLISAANSDNVANRLLKYYKALRTIKANIKVTNERCGSKYTFTNCFGENVSGYMTSMTYYLSSFIKGNCEFLADYTPDNMGNDFSGSVILTKEDETELSGVWTSPKTGTIRAILIAGGNGGSSGYAGAGAAGDGYGGEGGAAGVKGNGGKILNVTSISVTTGQTIQFHIGRGAEGGAECSSHTVNNVPTSEVTHQAGNGVTTFGSYSTTSSDAYVSATGVMDVFTGTVYALPGSTGAAGGNGGAAGSSSSKRSTSGDSVLYHGDTTLGGSGVQNVRAEEIKTHLGDEYSIVTADSHWDTNGCVPSTGGGGASAGVRGGEGYSSRYDTVRGEYQNFDVGSTRPVLHQYFNVYTTYGLTGKGADALARGVAATFGSGGSAGHGGGGEGGSPDTSYDSQSLQRYTNNANDLRANLYITRPSEHGTRFGKGGAGGDGADGCILIYL